MRIPLGGRRATHPLPSANGQAGPCHRGRSESGMVTAEFAVALPAVIIVLALALGALAAATDQLRCVDAARVGARAAARGDTQVSIQQVARRAAPQGSSVSVRGDRTVTVTVTAPSRALAAWLPVPLHPAAEATALREGMTP